METIRPQPWTGLTPTPSPSPHGSRYTPNSCGDRREAVVIRPPPDASIRSTHGHPSAGSISSHPLHARDHLQADADSVTDQLHPSLRARPPVLRTHKHSVPRGTVNVVPWHYRRAS